MQFGISTFVTDDAIGPADLGRAIEERGFDSLIIAEHTHIPAKRETPYPGGGKCRRSTTRPSTPSSRLPRRRP
ncbi:hypothetical protein [Kibdelosporangium philippinense]|uniref:hypothetical protein n=1 Tax=Kibdelosporangium philippinense TaxID=211113 RepID=UPI003617E63C